MPKPVCMMSLHSTMFLLIQEAGLKLKDGKILFTFHNVSINTFTSSSFSPTTRNFTFYNVSINTGAWFQGRNGLPGAFTFHNVSINTCHRTQMRQVRSSFTFHNVSINTTTRSEEWVYIIPLHSTMFLLIPRLLEPQCYYPVSFTFHNVSINTGGLSCFSCSYFALHSTMFLLIPAMNVFRHCFQQLYIPQCFY